MGAPPIPEPALIVGRREERDRITALALSPAEGGVVFTGNRGSGKTRLLEAARLESPIHSVLIRSNPSESEVSLSGFSALLGSTGDPRALDFCNHLALESRGLREIFAVARETLALLRSLQLEPHLVLVDDVDLMDPGSQLLIGFLAGRLAGTNLRLVCTANSDGVTSTFGGYEMIPLSPLPERELRELADHAVGRTAPGTSHILATRSAGNPAVLLDNAKSLSAGQVRGTEPLVLPFRPGSGVTAIEESLTDFSDPERELLYRVAMGPLADAAALTEISDEWSDAIDSLLESGTLSAHGRYVTVSDPCLRSLFYWHIDSGERRRLHDELATAHPLDASFLTVWHTSFAKPLDSTPALLTSAIDLVTRGEQEAAIEFAERSLRLSALTDTTIALLLDLSEALLRRGWLEFATRYLEYSRLNADDPRWAVREVTLALTIAYASGSAVPDVDVDTTVQIHSAQDLSGSVRLLDLAALCHTARWDLRRARSCVDRADRLLDRALTLPPPLHERATEAVGVIEGTARPTPADMYDWDWTALSRTDPEELLTYGLSLSHSEHYDDARRVFALVSTSSRLSEPIWHEKALYLAACNEIAAGDFHVAKAAIEDLARVPLRQLTPWSSRLYLQAWYATLTGKRYGSGALFLECLERASTENNAAVAAALYSLQGTMALLERDDEGALRLLELAERAAADVPNPVLPRHSADLVEAQVSRGRLADARQTLDAMIRAGATHPSRWLTLATARAEANLAPEQTRFAKFQDCVDMFALSDSPYEYAKTLANLARRHADLGHQDESERVYADARAALERAGAEAWSNILLIAESHSSPPVSSSILELLTDEERQIADLVCQGMRNREIATELFISLRSVEAKLTVIYRKVNARTRSHLVAMLTGVSP